MRIVTITDFYDKQSAKPEEIVPAGTTLNVKAERGQELIDAGIAVDGTPGPVTTDDPSPPTA
ncbi:hypothetical protein [Sphingomonas sp. MMS24-J13]|uniref:hypothetical protein n=1 Tax=Sphingomonas sp. MMS24-J13 TaxID=3238686 RepID=UPI00384EADEB